MSLCRSPDPIYAFPAHILASDIPPSENTVPKPDTVADHESYALFDFGRLTVGYTMLEYETDSDAEAVFCYDYTESIGDFQKDAKATMILERLRITEPMKKGRHTLQLLRRRATRFLLVRLSRNVKIHGIKFRISMLPATQKGWFHSSDPLLNKIWEVGKYTLEVNKHQEYESCPRNEMKFFSGDGIIDALIDYHLFGYPDLADASLSITELEVCIGTRHDLFSQNSELWDYPAWRIIMA